MVHQRLAHLQRVRHARAVDLGVDVADQIGLQIEILHQRERIVGVGARRMARENLRRTVTAETRLEPGREELAPERLANEPHGLRIGLNGVARERLERRLGPQHSRRPVRLRIQPPEQAEHGASHCERHAGTQTLLGEVQLIAPIPGEALVAAVAGQRDSHVAARELADAVGGDRRAVRIRFVVHAGELVDQIEVVARHVIDPVAGRDNAWRPSRANRVSS